MEDYALSKNETRNKNGAPDTPQKNQNQNEIRRPYARKASGPFSY
jgi:hypothetical protein